MRKIVQLAFMLLISASLHASVIYVNSSATGLNDGTSWANAFTNLEAGLAASTGGDSVWVSAGTYVVPAADFQFSIPANVGVYGGFPPTGNPGWGDRDWKGHTTIVSGDRSGDDDPFNVTGTRGDNSYRVFLVDSYAEINGMTLQNGGDLGSRSGAAVVVNGTTTRTLKMVDCIVKDCYGISSSGVAAGDGAIRLNCYGPTDTVSFENITFQQNAALKGGAVTIYGATVFFDNCKFNQNVSGEGAAVYLKASTHGEARAVLNNCSLYKQNYGFSNDNCFHVSGEGTTPATLIVANSTLHTNGAPLVQLREGGTTLSSWGVAVFENCIVYDPSYPTAPDMWEFSTIPPAMPPALTTRYCLTNAPAMTFGTDGAHSDNIYETTPIFDVADTVVNRFILDCNSPGVNDGNTSAAYLTTTDIEGNVRVDGDTIDIGAWESTCVTTSKDRVEEVEPFTVYPNPATSELRIQSSEPIRKIEILSLQGQKLKEVRGADHVEVETLPKGIYLIRIGTGAGQHTAKFVKQ